MYLEDLFEGEERWTNSTQYGLIPNEKTNKYLPRRPEESIENWTRRLNESYYDDSFSKTLCKMIDLTFQNGVKVKNENEIFDKHWDDITLEAQSGEDFLSEIAVASLLYGHTFILIDFPNIQVESLADFNEIKPRPYWIHVKPTQVINWRTKRIKGKTVLKMVVIKEEREIDVGEHLEETVTIYKKITPTSWEIYMEKEGTSQVVKVSEGVINAGENELDEVPLVPVYANLKDGNLKSKPPFKGLADKSKIAYQLQSMHNRKILLCCQPMPVIRDQSRNPSEKLTIGPNSFIQIRDPDGSFKWEEPLALSLVESRRTIEKIKEEINFDSANFISNPKDRQSAKASGLVVAPVEATLKGFTISFEDGINKAIAIHHKFIVEEFEENPKIKLNPNVFPEQKDSQFAFAIDRLVGSNIIPKQTAISELVKASVLSQDINIPQEFFDEETKSSEGGIIEGGLPEGVRASVDIDRLVAQDVLDKEEAQSILGLNRPEQEAKTKNEKNSSDDDRQSNTPNGGNIPR